MSPKKRDTSQKRASIIRAAIKAFQEDGYDKTSMDRIAEVAGASKRTVYNHFASKEALFGAVMDAYMGEMRELKRIPYDPDRPLEDQLADFADAKMELLRDPDWTGVMKVGLGVLIRDPELARASMAKADGDEDHLATWLADATSDGRLAVDEPEIAAKVFWATVAGAFFWPHLLESPMEPAMAKRFKAELIRTFLAAHAAADEPALA